MSARISPKEYSFIIDRLYWAEKMFALREKYADTPAGFQDAASVRASEEEIRDLKRDWDELTISLLIAKDPPAPGPHIINRTDLLNRIRLGFSCGNRLVILYGMGGVGKSTLAETYVWEHREDYDAVLYLTCEQGLGQAFFNDSVLHFSNLRYSTSLYRSEREYIRKKLETLAEIAGRQRILLLLDNCDFSSDAFMSRVFRIPADILVTTRIRPEAWSTHLPEQWLGIEVPADGFEKEEEWELFAEKLSSSSDWQTAKAQFRGNILAVRLHLIGTDGPDGAYYFRENGLTIPEKRLLCFISLLPLEGIPGKTLREVNPGGEKALRDLIRRGLLEQTPDDRIRMHPLIRQEVKNLIPPDVSLLKKIIHRLADMVYNAWEETYETNVAMEPYARALLEAFPDPPPNLAGDFDRFITLLWILCRGDDALRFSLRIYSACEERYGLVHEKTGFCALRTGAVFRNTGRIKEAEVWFRKAYDILEQARPSSPRMILYRIEANTRMSLISSEHGDMEGVRKYNLRALSLSETLKNKYPDILPGHRGDPSLEYPYALLHQGEYLFSVGEPDAAEEYLHRAIEALKTTNSAVYREIEFSRLQIRILLRRNCPETALPVAERCVSIARQYRGEISREYLRAMDLLADVMIAVGNPAEGMNICKTIMYTLARFYPGEEAWTASVLQKWSRAAIPGSVLPTKNT